MIVVNEMIAVMQLFLFKEEQRATSSYAMQSEHRLRYDSYQS